MSSARIRAARLRGVAVGAVTGAVAVAAHSFGGAQLPAAPSLVLMVLACGVIGAIAASPADAHRRFPVILAYVSAGQAVGHATLTLVSHHHAGQWSPAMVAAHGAAALCCAALIYTAERLFAAFAGVLWQLILVLVAVRDGSRRHRRRPIWRHGAFAARLLAIGGPTTRGPPRYLFAA